MRDWHESRTRAIRGFVKREWPVIAWAVSFALIALALYQVSQLTNKIHESQIAVCEAALKPGGVRYIVAEQIRFQVEQSQNFDYSKFFPNVPQDQLEQLLAAQRERSLAEIHQLLDVDCDAVYPKP